MKILQWAALLLLAALGAVLLLGPIGPVPGVLIGGTAAEVPAAWPDTSDTHEIRLRVPGTLPRVVTIWVIQHDGDLHVVGARDSGWVGMIGSGSPVQMRLNDRTYSLRAEPVSRGWEPVFNAYVDKYRPDYPEIVAGFPPPEEAGDQIAVFRLVRG